MGNMAFQLRSIISVYKRMAGAWQKNMPVKEAQPKLKQLI